MTCPECADIVSGCARWSVQTESTNRQADSLQKPRDTGDEPVYAATVCMRAGRYQKSMVG